ncbi:Probable LRR receptor-like serine/threonine-protein kinase At3g47570 [Linum perenne]
MVTGDPLGALSSWNDSVHFCEWYGVSCSKRHHGRVTVLNLSSHGLYGSISPHVGNLSFLKFLCLYNNNFIGEIPPEISHLHRLQRLSLHNNLLDGEIPSNISRCFNLIIFDVCHNKLVGRLPWKFSQLNKLQYLNVRSNNLSGSIPLAFGYIPSTIGNLTKLIELSMSNNYLSGEIPASIQNCQKILKIELAHNNLSGVIPLEVFSLTSLSIFLDLSSNRFTGTIPTEVDLEGLYMQDNHLQGIIPSSLSSLRGIQELDLSTNKLSGQIPEFFESMNISKKLNLSHNNFEGEVPRQGVFKNNSIVSVIGNSKLCGGIASLQLPPCNITRHSNKTLSLKWKIVISTISSLLLLTFVGSCCFILLIKKRGKQDMVSTDDPKLLQLSYQTLFKATDGFSSANQIGVGSFGLVYKGVLNEIGGASINIGVKVFKLQRHGAFKSFMAECEALKNIRHKNLVRIVTVCSIYEFLANGSLEDWLHQPVERIDESTTTRSLNFSQRLNVAIDIASAVHYLHNYCGTPIVHCDLKPSNVLLDEDMVAHVGDFGLARFLSTVANPSSSTIGIKGTIGYAPPEYGMGNEVSIQGDIYSYGILQLELFTGRRPTDETFKDGLSLHNVVKSAMSKQRTYEVVDPVLLDELLRKLTTHHSSSEEARKDLEELMSSILEIGVACSSDIPEARVSMSEVLSKSYRH